MGLDFLLNDVYPSSKVSWEHALRLKIICAGSFVFPLAYFAAKCNGDFLSLSFGFMEAPNLIRSSIATRCPSLEA